MCLGLGGGVGGQIWRITVKASMGETSSRYCLSNHSSPLKVSCVAYHYTKACHVILSNYMGNVIPRKKKKIFCEGLAVTSCAAFSGEFLFCWVMKQSSERID